MKKFVSCILALILLCSTFSISAFAAETEPAAVGDGDITVSYSYNKTARSVTAEWAKVSGAVSYTVWLMNYDSATKLYFQVGLPVVVSASAARTCTFDKSYLLDYGMGSKYYWVKVSAYDSGKNELAKGYSVDFVINDIPMLGKPEITFNAYGDVTWTDVGNAETCRVMVVDTETHQGRFVDVPFTQRSYNMASYMTDGKSYYAVCTAMADGYRNNKSAASETLTANVKPPVLDLKWSGSTLSWSPFSGATHYIIYLEKYDNASETYQQLPGYHDTLLTSYDAAEKMKDAGYGTFRATVLALKEGGVVISAPTQSPAIIRSQPTGIVVGGSVKSFLSETDEIKITLRNLTVLNATANVTVYGNNTTYFAQNLSPGQFIIYASKKNHATRTYSLPVSGTHTQNIELHPLGDINGDGKVTTVDFGKANAHARGKARMEGYEFSCADINLDGSITTADAGKINSHARGKTKLW